jgi:hypothetical protein
MVNQKSKYRIYRDDDSDDEDELQSRTLLLAPNGRSVVEAFHSPQKRKIRSHPGSDKWEPSSHFESEHGGFYDIDDGEHLLEGGSEVNVADIGAAKRYPTSVSEHFGGPLEPSHFLYRTHHCASGPVSGIG